MGMTMNRVCLSQDKAQKDPIPKHPYFEKLNLTNDDFDTLGNKEFKSLPNLKRRGGFPYYPPAKGTRYGLNVSHYDNARKNWLETNGQEEEWAVGYYALQNRQKIDKLDTPLEKILKRHAMTEQHTLVNQENKQPYLDQPAVNHPSQKIKRGIYVTPHLEECLNSTKPVMVQDIQYKIVIQCRINPKFIQICPNNKFWAIENSHIRPYGLILLHEKQFLNYPTAQTLFKEEFTWLDYVDQVNKFLKIEKIQPIKQNQPVVVKEVTKDVEPIVRTVKNEIIYDFVDTKKNNCELIQTTAQTFTKLDKIYAQNPAVAVNVCKKILEAEVPAIKLQESVQIQKKMLEQHRKQEGGVPTLLLGIQQGFKSSDKQSKLLFEEKSSIKTQITAKVLFSDYLQNRVKITVKVDSQWNFKEIQSNPKKRQQFQIIFKKDQTKKYHLLIEDIQIVKISEGIKVAYTYPNIEPFLDDAVKNVITIEAVVKHFALSSEDFEPIGSNSNNTININFSDHKATLQTRGGHPYYQPAHGKRYGIKVSKKYDGGNDAWLGMKNQTGEWAAAFHGMKNPASDFGDITVLKNIMNGLKTNSMLIPGGGQAFQSHQAVNKPSVKVGKGVYFSPHIEQCINSYAHPVQIDGKNYKMILQVRLNPKAIKICTNQKYWVVNNSIDIRPYGIIMVKQAQYNNYPLAINLYKQEFHWKKYQKQVNDFLARSK